MALVVFPRKSSKEYILLKLWESSKWSCHNIKKKLTLQSCRELVSKYNSFGKVSGKLLNVNFTNFPAIIQIKYDEINGRGSMQKVADFCYQQIKLTTFPCREKLVQPNRDRSRSLNDKEWELIDVSTDFESEPEEIN
tara:strand:- start:1761 stop:2171 length:411 start_codon:yes stop_codon:yes gene_type:complete